MYRYRELFKFSDPTTDSQNVSLTVVGEHLECDVLSGLQILVNTEDDPSEEMCQLQQELKRCRFVQREATLCKYECDCPVHAGGCQAGLLYWNQQQQMPENPWQICEIWVH